MAGKLCNGTVENSAQPFKDSKAYCEGMAYRASDTVLSVPITDNPHEADSESNASWAAGWTAANGAGTIDASEAGCCALVGAVVPA